MTPDQELRSAILDRPASGGASGARAKAASKAQKRAKRHARAERQTRLRWRLRFLLMAMSLGGSALMVLTEGGRELRVEFQTAVLDLVSKELAARREAQVALAAPVPTQEQALDDIDTALAGQAVALRSGPKGLVDAATPPPDTITFVPAQGLETEWTGRPVVRQMPESRVRIRRLADGG